MFRILALCAASAGLVMTAAADPHDVYGTFLTEAGTSHVTIAPCGAEPADTTPCGTVTWLDPAALPDGITPETAVSDAGDKVLGLVMLKGFDKRKKDWRGGTIYDPENDKTYASRLKRLEDGSLELKGCIGPICQTQIWSDVSAETAG